MHFIWEFLLFLEMCLLGLDMMLYMMPPEVFMDQPGIPLSAFIF